MAATFRLKPVAVLTLIFINIICAVIGGKVNYNSIICGNSLEKLVKHLGLHLYR